MSSRKRWKTLLAIVLIALFGAIWLYQRETDKTPEQSYSPDHILLSWAADPATSMTISWRTSPEVSQSMVQYAPRPSDDSPPETFSLTAGKSTLMKTELGDYRIHSVTITRLKPGTAYLYRVGDGGGWSNLHSFTTAPNTPGPFTAVVFGDSQCSLENYRVWRKTLLAAVKRETPRFIINTGDLVDNGGDQRHWEAWFAAGEGVLEGLPEMPAVGNHESPWLERNRLPQSFRDQFTLPENGPPELKELVYSFDYGDAHFVILDSQVTHWPSLLKPQQNWLQEDLEKTRKKWKIAIFHRPPYYAKTNRPNEDVKEAFCRIIEENGVDLVINGHDHAVMRTYPIAGGNISAGAKGTVYLIAGRSGEKTYTDLTRKRWACYFYNPLDQPTYTVLRFNDGELRITGKKADGTVLDTCVIKKEE